jgi:tetratricopeptide (TPR) repeat protein
MGSSKFDDWDLNAALTHFSRARELNPNSIDTCQCFPMLLSALGRHPESISLIEHALKLDPLSNTTHFEAGLVYHFARRYADAERHLRLSLELQPEQYPAYIVLADVMKATGRAEEAIKVLDRVPFQRSAFMASAYAAAGRRREANTLLDELVKGRGPFEYLNIALTYLALGNRDAALEWLAKAMDAHQGYMRWVGVIPFLDPLRDDPRFQAIIAPLKLPAADGPPTR